MTHFLRFFRFDAKLALGALAAVAAARLLLWLVPFRIWHRVCEQQPRRARRRLGVDRSRRWRIAQAVSVAARLVPAASCLTQALAAKMLLGWRGEEASVCFGAARTDRGAFAAHAWLESGGEVIVGALPELHRYRRFTREPLPS